MSLLRLPALDRPSLALSKRFSLLSTKTTGSSINNDANSSLTSLHTLPSFERLDSDGFLTMFETQNSRPLEGTTCSPQPQITELSTTIHTSRFPELHGQSVHLAELSSMSLPRPTVCDRAFPEADVTQVDYRSSASFSNPSTKNSNASSRRTRKSSVSSVTDEYSASEYSSRDSDREVALHERLKRRPKGRRKNVLGISSRFSVRTTQPQFQTNSKPRLSAAIVLQPTRRQTSECQELDGTSVGTIRQARPDSRGGRLGRAMAEGLTTSPTTSPRQASFHSHSRSLSGQQQVKKSPRSRKTSSELVFTTPGNKILPMPHVDGMDQVRVGIMCQLDSLVDLQACSQVSRSFRQTFQKYETFLVDRVLLQQSPAAWELRHSVRHLEKPSPFRLRSVQRDVSTIAALEDFIVWRCQAILRPDTLNALLGENSERKAQLEEALWTIWTFCNLFGKTSMSDATLLKQTQWLNGGITRVSSASSGDMTRASPASIKELEDMSEMWRCLDAILSDFKGQEKEARRIGLFDNVGETKATDTELLNTWISDILSLGPKAALTLSSCDFEQAKVLGVTRWTPPAKGKSRSTFLKAAVEEVYRERLMQEARRKASEFKKSMKEAHKRSLSDPPIPDLGRLSHKQRQQTEGKRLHLDTRQAVCQPTPTQEISSIQQERIEVRPDCDPSLSAFSYPVPILSPSTNPTVFSPLGMTKNASAKLGANLFPMQNRDQFKRNSIALVSAGAMQVTPEVSDVVDPVDKAVALLVYDMGFSEASAKRALAMSDTGSGINIQEAIELLSVDSPLPVTTKQVQICELPAAVGNAKLSQNYSKREYCEGSCKPLMLVNSRKDRVTGLGLVERGMSYRMSLRKSNQLSVIVDDEEVAINNTRFTNNANPNNALPAVSKLTSSTPDTLAPTTTLSRQATIEEHTCAGALPSPVSPVTPSPQEWLKSDTNPGSDAEAYLNNLPLKPRVTLTRVGTGINKTRWSFPGKKRKEHIIQPEVIGFAC